MSLQTYIFQIQTHTNTPSCYWAPWSRHTNNKNKFSSSHNAEASLQFVQRAVVWCSTAFQTSLYSKTARWSAAKPYTQHTRKKTRQQNDRLLSQKYHISFKRKSTQNTWVLVLDVLSVHHFDEYFFSYLFGSRSWTLVALHLPKFNTFPCQVDVYNCTRFQMMTN